MAACSSPVVVPNPHHVTVSCNPPEELHGLALTLCLTDFCLPSQLDLGFAAQGKSSTYVLHEYHSYG